jgi:hypothetical protein
MVNLPNEWGFEDINLDIDQIEPDLRWIVEAQDARSRRDLRPRPLGD